MIEKKLRALKFLRELLFDGLLDDTGAGKSDEGFGLGQDHVGQHRETGRHASEGRVGQNDDVRNARLGEPADRGGGLGHLHQGKNPFLHPRAPRGGHHHKRDTLAQGAVGGQRHFLADDRPHAPAHEPEMKHPQHDPIAVDPALPDHHRVLLPSTLLGRMDPVGIALGILEMKGVGGDEARRPLAERAEIKKQIDAVFHRNRKMVLAFRADLGAPLHFLPVHDRPAVIALEPEPLGNLDLFPVLVLLGETLFLEPRHIGNGQRRTTWPSSSTERLGRFNRLSSAAMTLRYEGFRW